MGRGTCDGWGGALVTEREGHSTALSVCMYDYISV